VIDSERMETLDDKYNIIAIAMAPRTVLIQNVFLDADMGKLREKLTKMAEITWLQAENVAFRRLENLSLFGVTSSEIYE
jgi:predicted nuclease of predicted toxin-antitoxin system